MAQLKFKDGVSERLDRYLSRTYPHVSRSYIEKQIESGLVEVNSNPTKPGYKLKAADIIKLPNNFAQLEQPAAIKLTIVYEDEFCIVIDKPSGILTHAKGESNNEPSVASFISDRISPEMRGNRAGIVHRLDRGTSGLLVAAKTNQAQAYLQRQFAKRQVEKRYLAIVTGKLERAEAIINMPIERNPKQPATFRTGAKGKPAETYYKVIEQTPSHSLLELKPTTGRTHQLRVHLRALNQPIVGDELYGGEAADRLMLHASRLVITLPDKGRVVFNSSLPVAFKRYLEN